MNELLLMHVMCGVPGSGKSHLANQLKGDGGKIFSTDDFWYDDEGRYVFNFKNLKIAHEWNIQRVHDAAKDRVYPIIVDNTNTTAKERQAYVDIADKFGYTVIYSLPNSEWWMAAEVLMRATPPMERQSDEFAELLEEFDAKNSHNVPITTIWNMINRFEIPPDEETQSAVLDMIAAEERAAVEKSKVAEKAKRKAAAEKAKKEEIEDSTES